jgi:apolipoprotein N-acyltransferase
VRLRATRETRAAILSGFLFALAFPPFVTVIAPLICLVPVGVAVGRAADEGESSKVAWRAGLWFGLIGYGANLYWIAVALMIFTPLAALGYVGALIWLVPYVALSIVVLFALRRRTKLPLAILVPVVWVALELVLNYLGPLSFPWLPLGLATWNVPLLAQFADVSGVRGVSLWIAAINGIAADAWMMYRNGVRGKAYMRPAVIVVGILLMVVAYGAWRIASVPLRPLAPIAVIQPNVSETEKIGQHELADEEKERVLMAFGGDLARLTRQVLDSAPARLVVWPETALPNFLLSYPGWRDTLQSATSKHHAPILTGVMDDNRKGGPDWEYYNAAIVTDSVGNVPNVTSYRKGYLVPVVERVPFLNPKWFQGMNYFGSFGFGVDPQAIALPFGKLGILICYESIFPQLSRRYRKQGARLLVNITNDAWFGRSSAPYQHFSHLVIRAIENRLPVVRSANTGISAYIDPLGNVHGATPLFVSAARTYDVQTSDVTTLYTRVGDWIGALCLGTTVLLLFATWRRRPAGTGQAG